MGSSTKIEWCDKTFNPWRGCQKVSEGCKNCYAETLSGRNPKTLGVWGPNGTRVVASESMWQEPLKWDKAAKAAGERHRVFCASLADVFEDWTGLMSASDGGVLHVCNACGAWRTMDEMCHGPTAHFLLTMADVRNRLFRLIDNTPNLDWLVLTKRPENIERMMPPFEVTINYRKRKGSSHCEPNPFPHQTRIIELDTVRRNLWLGASIENQATADERIPHLLRVPAAVRFLSVEPLLGPIGRMLGDNLGPAFVGGEVYQGIDWVIVGGESGPGARPMKIEWVRDIVRQCKAAGVPVFVKQLGAMPTGDYYEDREHFECNGYDWPDPIGHVIPRDGQPPIGSRVVLPVVDRKGGDMSEWPEDLMVREFPGSENV